MMNQKRSAKSLFNKSSSRLNKCNATSFDNSLLDKKFGSWVLMDGDEFKNSVDRSKITLAEQHFGFDLK